MCKENEQTDLSILKDENDLRRASLIGRYLSDEQPDDHVLKDLPKKFFTQKIYKIKNANGKEYEIPIDLPSLG